MRRAHDGPAAVDWGPIDPVEWQPDPPREPVDLDLVWLYACRRVMHDRIARLDRARAAAAKAIVELLAANEQADRAIDLLEQAVEEYVAAKGTSKCPA